MMKKFFTKHPLMKMIALLLSVAMWWFVRSERQNEKTVDVPVVYANIPSNLIYSGSLQETIRLRLRGPQSKLAKVDDEYFSNHVIDLSGAKSGSNPFWLYEDDFRLPFGVYITQIFPQAIRVGLKPKELRRIAIRPRYVGELPPGIEIEKYTIEPNTIQFESFADELDKIKFFYTEPINLTGKMKDFEGEYFIDTSTFRGQLDSDKVKIVFDLVEKEISEAIPSVPIVLGGGDASVSVEPDTVEITVAGPLSKVLKVVKTPPIPRLDEESFKKAIESRKDQQISIVFDEVKDVTLTVKPSKVWVRFK